MGLLVKQGHKGVHRQCIADIKSSGFEARVPGFESTYSL